MEMEVKKKGLLERFLRGVEVLGNKIPNPMLLFISLCIIVVLASAICSFFNVSAVNPVPPPWSRWPTASATQSPIP